MLSSKFSLVIHLHHEFREQLQHPSLTRVQFAGICTYSIDRWHHEPTFSNEIDHRYVNTNQICRSTTPDDPSSVTVISYLITFPARLRLYDQSYFDYLHCRSSKGLLVVDKKMIKVLGHSLSRANSLHALTSRLI